MISIAFNKKIVRSAELTVWRFALCRTCQTVGLALRSDKFSKPCISFRQQFGKLCCSNPDTISETEHYGSSHMNWYGCGSFVTEVAGWVHGVFSEYFRQQALHRPGRFVKGDNPPFWQAVQGGFSLSRNRLKHEYTAVKNTRKTRNAPALQLLSQKSRTHLIFIFTVWTRIPRMIRMISDFVKHTVTLIIPNIPVQIFREHTYYDFTFFAVQPPTHPCSERRCKNITRCQPDSWHACWS